MRTASIAEAKNSLSALIDSLKSGSPVLIVDRGRPVARLEPVGGSAHDDPEGRLSRLVRDGLLRPRRRDAPPDLFSSQPPHGSDGISVVDALVEERREGR